MCVMKKLKAKQEAAQEPTILAAPPPPQPVADELTIDPKRKREKATARRAGRSSLVIQRSVGGVGGGSGLSIGAA